jgi:segregation and condensation protein A
MASNLLYIKSRDLLPDPKEEEENPKEELISKLIEYKQIKEISELMKRNNEEFSKLYYKGPENLTFKKQLKLEKEYPVELIPTIFMRIAQNNLNKINHNSNDINKLLTREEITVKSKIKEILKYFLKQNKLLIFNKVFSVKERSKNDVITAFLAMLELNRANRVKIQQDYLFDDIKVKKEWYKWNLQKKRVY